jgi:predicted aldo/keto reductase-like oxidoreductase
VKLRDRVYVATKLPAGMLKARQDMDRFLATSLERLGMDHIDYYLVHNLNSLGSWERVKKLGIIEFLEKAKADGKIHHIGFSWHGNLHDFRKIIDDYDWGFCQIQYNYLDENFQAGTEGLRYAAAKGVGVIVMEPLRGVTLARKLPHDAMKIIDGYMGADGKTHTPAYWGLSWVWNHPEVTLALSGMNDIKQIEENATASAAAHPGMLTESDLRMIERVKEVFQRSLRVNCTGCSYCMPCPYGINIPFCLSALNDYAMFGGIGEKAMYNMTLRKTNESPDARASACRKCGGCESKCPQNIPIIKTLEETAKTMESPFYNAIAAILGKLLR